MSYRAIRIPSSQKNQNTVNFGNSFVLKTAVHHRGPSTRPSRAKSKGSGQAERTQRKIIKLKDYLFAIRVSGSKAGIEHGAFCCAYTDRKLGMRIPGLKVIKTVSRRFSPENLALLNGYLLI